MLAKSEYTIQVEPFMDAYADAKELLEAHWHEIAPYKDFLTVNPDLDAYKKLDEKGALSTITVRKDGKLIGYIVFFISRHLHYSDIFVATDDLHFLHPDYRKSLIGLKMFRFAEEEMRRRGVGLIAMRTKARSDINHSAIFERLGYDRQDIVFTKRLDRG